MKKWMQKLIEQLEWTGKSDRSEQAVSLTEDRATLLFYLDILNKNLFEIDTQPIRKIRENLDEFSRELLSHDPEKIEKTLFRLRQYLSTLRIDEATYIKKTFDDFRHIIWDFIEQLSGEIHDEKIKDLEVRQNLESLKDAVESNSIQTLKAQSRQFIDSYIELQTRRDHKRTHRLESVRKNLDQVKKKLNDAQADLNLDHLTKTHNRKSFEENVKNAKTLYELYHKPACLLMVDIDYFKRINDTYGHSVGDVIIQECVRHLKEIFVREQDVVARIGGEEFAVILPDYQLSHAHVRAEMVLMKIRNEAYVKGDLKVQFTVSIGVAELAVGESTDSWIKRADQALYHSKNTGRDRLTLSQNTTKQKSVA